MMNRLRKTSLFPWLPVSRFDLLRNYERSELMSYYHDWEILFSVEEIFDCMSGGIPHKHAVNRIIARRYPGSM